MEPDSEPPLSPTHDEERRKFAAAEILLSEKSYVKDLRATMTAFVTPLQNNARSEAPVLSLDEWFVMFKQFEPILLLAEVILQALEDEAAHEGGSIGQIFQDLAPFLRMYISYVNAHSAASELHSELMERGRRNADGQTPYAAFLEECAAQNQESLKGRLLTDLLIMPIQRIPRYRLLLEELIKRSPPGDEMDSLEKGLASISDVANTVNTSLAEFENRNAIVRVQAEFGNQQVFIAPHRKFIKEGFLNKMCRKGPRPYRFVLFSDLLVYGVEDELALAKISQRYRFKQKFVLAQCKLTKESETSFSVASPTKSFVVLGPDAATTADWVDKIETALAEVVPQSKEQQEQVVHAPVWVPDKEARACHVCEVPFTLFRRRHHCRQCGQVVCDKCSPHRWFLPHIDPHRAQRMCNNCYLEVRKAFEEDNFLLAGALDQPRPGPPPPEKKSRLAPVSLLAVQSSSSSFSSSSSSSQQQFHQQQAIKTSDEKGELPRNWRQLADEQGRAYYWNVTTDAVSYERPTGKVVGQWRHETTARGSADTQPPASPLKKTAPGKSGSVLPNNSGKAEPAAKTTAAAPAPPPKPAVSVVTNEKALKSEDSSPIRSNKGVTFESKQSSNSHSQQPQTQLPVNSSSRPRPQSVRRPSMVGGTPLSELLSRYEQQGKFGQQARFSVKVPKANSASSLQSTAKPSVGFSGGASKDHPSAAYSSSASPSSSSAAPGKTPPKTPVVLGTKKPASDDGDMTSRPVSMRISALEKPKNALPDKKGTSSPSAAAAAAAAVVTNADRRLRVPNHSLYANDDSSPAVITSQRPLANDLSDKDFMATFGGMSKANFAKLPAWQQLELKNAKGYL